MNNVDVTLFKTESAKILKRAQKEAITVMQDGKPEAVMISPELYEHYEKLEDAYLAEKFAQRRTEGHYLSHEDSLSALKSIDLGE